MITSEKDDVSKVTELKSAQIISSHKNKTTRGSVKGGVPPPTKPFTRGKMLAELGKKKLETPIEETERTDNIEIVAQNTDKFFFAVMKENVDMETQTVLEMETQDADMNENADAVKTETQLEMEIQDTVTNENVDAMTTETMQEMETRDTVPNENMDVTMNENMQRIMDEESMWIDIPSEEEKERLLEDMGYGRDEDDATDPDFCPDEKRYSSNIPIVQKRRHEDRISEQETPEKRKRTHDYHDYRLELTPHHHTLFQGSKTPPPSKDNKASRNADTVEDVSKVVHSYAKKKNAQPAKGQTHHRRL